MAILTLVVGGAFVLTCLVMLAGAVLDAFRTPPR